MRDPLDELCAALREFSAYPDEYASEVRLREAFVGAVKGVIEEEVGITPTSDDDDEEGFL